ncbi:uncharacterized protein AB675_9306 [Cyphellophora attinorum]|uniref:Ecp2 effector protein domain-containing protein n=1 Tax=Cyphellophora attinorum TaxID=1664694 RepID=A0A0N1HVY6_9EURO|nr:uncharacterized protein AB675_9306 [Phialophora attinorum]KPI41603.1 hypothetical protein AB675_9306 [Phialophora attinorum]
MKIFSIFLIIAGLAFSLPTSEETAAGFAESLDDVGFDRTTGDITPDAVSLEPRGTATSKSKTTPKYTICQNPGFVGPCTRQEVKGLDVCEKMPWVSKYSFPFEDFSFSPDYGAFCKVYNSDSCGENFPWMIVTKGVELLKTANQANLFRGGVLPGFFSFRCWKLD